MAYSPGVGAVCEEIEKDHSVADTMTLRPRSIAVVTDGSFLDASPDGVGPALDWIIAQIKYFSGLDAFPFIVAKDINLEEALKDLTTSYGTVLYLDSKEVKSVPADLLFVRQSDIAKAAKVEITDAEKTANAINHLISNKVKGIANETQIKAGLNNEGHNFKNFVPYSH